MSEISQRDAEGKLAKAVANFDWIENFLGGQKRKLLTRYRALHAQLRGEDKLDIEVRAVTHRGSYGAEIIAPTFSIVLHTKDKKTVVANYDKDSYSGTGELLYQD